MRSIALMILIMAAGCKGKEETKAAPSSSSEAPATNAPAAPAAPAAAPAATIDICSFASKADIEAVIGPLSGEPQAEKPQGSLLAQCTYNTETGVANVSARPAREFKGTVEYSGKAESVPGIGKNAVLTEKAGMMVELDGKSYFLNILVAGANGFDGEKAKAIAKIVAANAK